MWGFFKKNFQSLTGAAIIIAVASLASRILGVFRDRILAGEFGAGETLDIYYSSFRLPDLIFNLLILGALSAGFVPVFISLINKKTEAWKLANNVLNSLVIALVFISILGIILSAEITRLIAPGFSVEAQAQVTSLTRIMFLSPLFLGLSSVLGGILQSFKRFLVYSLAPIMYNLGIIAGALFFYPWLGIKGLAWGVVLGAFMHFAIQVLPVRALGFRFKFFFDLKERSLRKIFAMMVPRTLSLAIAQINLLVITIMASKLAAGSLTVFNLANNLQSFPIGIFAISFAVAAFPLLAEQAGDDIKILNTFSAVARRILFFIIPATVLLITLRAQIVRVILGSGNFSWQDTTMTMEALAFFSISLFAQALIPLQARMFYAKQDTATPLWAGAASVIANIILAYFLAPKMGVAGLALAYSLANIVNFLVLWFAMLWQIKGFDQLKMLLSVAKFSLAAILAGLAIQLGKFFVWPFINMEKLWGVLTQGLFSGLLGLSVYLLLCYAFGSEELLEFIAAIKKKIHFRSAPDQDSGEVRGV